MWTRHGLSIGGQIDAPVDLGSMAQAVLMYCLTFYVGHIIFLFPVVVNQESQTCRDAGKSNIQGY
jgi:hypothetical protein